MKQLLFSGPDGQVLLETLPIPLCGQKHVLIRTRRSLLQRPADQNGPGEKIRNQPGLTRQILQDLSDIGLLPDRRATPAQTGTPSTACVAGMIVQCGEHAGPFRIGQRVVAPACHAEVVAAEADSCVCIPDGVTDQQACLAMAGASALEITNTAIPHFGQNLAVIGLDLVGMMALQLIRQSGCHVLAIDPSDKRRQIASTFGAAVAGTDPQQILSQMQQVTGGQGFDAVILRARSVNRDLPRLAGQITKDCGKVILSTRQVTTQIGAEPNKGLQILCCRPQIGQVQTQQMKTVLAAMAEGRLQTDALVTGRFPISGASQAVRALAGDADQLGVAIEYPALADLSPRIVVHQSQTTEQGQPCLAVASDAPVDLDAYLTAWADQNGQLTMVASDHTAWAKRIARKFRGHAVINSCLSAVSDPDIGAVLVAGQQAPELAIQALGAGKKVFLHQPVKWSAQQVTTLDELRRQGGLLMVGQTGHNSRPLASACKTLEGRAHPVRMSLVVGGTSIQSAARAMFSARTIAQADIASVAAAGWDRLQGGTILVSFSDGSSAACILTARASKAGKLEAFCGQEHIRCRTLWPARAENRRRREQFEAFALACRQGQANEEFQAVLNVAEAMAAVGESARTDQAITLTGTRSNQQACQDQQVVKTASWRPANKTHASEEQLRKSA